MCLSIVWTLSRSGIIALGAGLSIVSVCAAARLRGLTRGASVALLLPAVALAVGWRGVDAVAGWYGRTGTLAWRIALWRDTWPIVRDFWWSGSGLDTYGLTTLAYPTSDRAWHAMEAHSDYVQIASEGGLLLAAAALGAVVALALAIRRRFAEPQSSSIYWVRVGASAALVAIAVQELTDFSLQMPGNAVLFAIVAALALHRPRPSPRDPVVSTEPL
jgi:O-antigen ligase